MTKLEFLRLLEGQLELPAGTLKGDQTLGGLDSWDSMASVLFIALADEKLGVTISGSQIAKSRDVNELLGLLGDRLASG